MGYQGGVGLWLAGGCFRLLRVEPVRAQLGTATPKLVETGLEARMKLKLCRRVPRRHRVVRQGKCVSTCVAASPLAEAGAWQQVRGSRIIRMIWTPCIVVEVNEHPIKSRLKWQDDGI